MNVDDANDANSYAMIVNTDHGASWKSEDFNKVVTFESFKTSKVLHFNKESRKWDTLSPTGIRKIEISKFNDRGQKIGVEVVQEDVYAITIQGGDGVLLRFEK